MNRQILRLSCLLCFLSWLNPALYAQQKDPASWSPPGIPGNFLDRLQSKLSGLDKEVDVQSQKCLARMARREERLAKKLKELHPDLDTRSYAYAATEYSALEQKLRSDTGDSATAKAGTYLPKADSIRLSLAFLQQHPSLLATLELGSSAESARNTLHP